MQLGLAAALALGLAALVDVDGGWSARLLLWLFGVPPLLVASLVDGTLTTGALSYLVLSLITFMIAVPLLLPLRHWIDVPDRRPHHARVGAVVVAAYVVTSLVVGYVWTAFSGW